MEPEARYRDWARSADRPGVKHPDFHGDVITAFEWLPDKDTVRAIDGLAVHKYAAGHKEVAHLRNMTTDDAIQLGTRIGAPHGPVIEGEEATGPAAEAGAAEAATETASAFSGEDGFGDQPWFA
jgi:hypothetical protein